MNQTYGSSGSSVLECVLHTGVERFAFRPSSIEHQIERRVWVSEVPFRPTGQSITPEPPKYGGAYGDLMPMVADMEEGVRPVLALLGNVAPPEYPPQYFRRDLGYVQ